MRIVPVLLCIVLVAEFASALRFQGNVSVDISNNIVQNGWEYRATALANFNTGGLKTLFYTSVDVDGRTTNNAGSYNISGVAGAGIFLDTQVPYSFLASFSAESSWGINLPNLATFDVEAAAGYIATAYLRLDEIAPNGTVVASQSLRMSQLHIINGLQYTLDYVQTSPELSSVSYVGRPRQGDWYINITFIASSVVGVIDLANAVVGPSSLEQVVQIYNWPYLSPQNYLSLVMMTVSGSSSSSSSADATVVSCGSGSSQVYFTASATAVVDGHVNGVNVLTSASASAPSDLSTKLITQIAEAYSTGVTYTTVSVGFPANAVNIAYDPSVGSGKPLPTSAYSTSDALSVVVSSFMAGVVFASLLL